MFSLKLLVFHSGKEADFVQTLANNNFEKTLLKVFKMHL